MAKLFRLRRGDTLIEVIMAFAILSSLLIIASSGAISAWRSSRSAGERTQATYLAERQAQGLKAYKSSMTWDQFTNYAGIGNNLSATQYLSTNGNGATGGDGNCTNNPEFFVKVTTPDGAQTDNNFGKWALNSFDVNNPNIEQLSASKVVGGQNSASSTYTVGVEVHQVNSGNNGLLRFDICVTWPSLLRKGGTEVVNEIVYLSDSQL